MSLLNKKSKERKGVLPLVWNEINIYLKKLKNTWEVIDQPASGKKIVFTFKFKNFREAIDFVNKVADLSESENHHPNIHILYNRVKIVLSTHSIGGLSENDFIVAAKIEKLI